MPVEITASICTYNRIELLAKALESLCQQTLSPRLFEILVVDNALSDSLYQMVDDCRVRYPEHRIFYVPEARLGTGFARNLAARQARADYVAYIDDDAQADVEWLERALEIIQAYNRPACLGGPIFPFFTTSKPEWFSDQYETRSLGEHQRLLHPEEAISGSNMIWRKDVLVSVGGFGEDLGPRGNDFAIGEDSAAFRKLWRYNSSSVVVYSPDLRVYHWVPAYKMRVSHYIKRAFLTGQSEFKLLGRSGLAWRAIRIIRGIGYIIIRGIRALLRFRNYPTWQNWVIEETLPVYAKVGLVFAALGIYIPMKR